MMQKYQKWIWQQTDWPNFNYDLKQLLPELTNLSRLISALEMTCHTLAGTVDNCQPTEKQPEKYWAKKAPNQHLSTPRNSFFFENVKRLLDRHKGD